MLKLITARFPGKCAETSKPIRPGDEILYDTDERKAYHRLSNKALEFQPMDETAQIAFDTEQFYDRWLSKE
jgi:hypothetical protein